MTQSANRLADRERVQRVARREEQLPANRGFARPHVEVVECAGNAGEAARGLRDDPNGANTGAGERAQRRARGRRVALLGTRERAAHERGRDREHQTERPHALRVDRGPEWLINRCRCVLDIGRWGTRTRRSYSFNGRRRDSAAMTLQSRNEPAVLPRGGTPALARFAPALVLAAVVLALS